MKSTVSAFVISFTNKTADVMQLVIIPRSLYMTELHQTVMMKGNKIKT